jgi:hypothetical protein
MSWWRAAPPRRRLAARSRSVNPGRPSEQRMLRPVMALNAADDGEGAVTASVPGEVESPGIEAEQLTQL